MQAPEASSFFITLPLFKIQFNVGGSSFNNWILFENDEKIIKMQYIMIVLLKLQISWQASSCRINGQKQSL